MKKPLYVFAVLSVLSNLIACTETFEDVDVHSTLGEEDLELHEPD